jgi:hypothetical protein
MGYTQDLPHNMATLPKTTRLQARRQEVLKQLASQEIMIPKVLERQEEMVVTTLPTKATNPITIIPVERQSTMNQTPSDLHPLNNPHTVAPLNLPPAVKQECVNLSPLFNQATLPDSVDGMGQTLVETLKRSVTSCLDTLTDSGSTQPPPVKKVKPSVIRPNFNVKYADHLVHIGNARYLLCGETEDDFVLRIQECQYQKPVGGVKQFTKRVKFTIQQWMDLMDEVDSINTAILEFDHIQLHLGGNLYLRVQPIRRRVDMREYFLPEGRLTNLAITPDKFEPFVIPTRQGISLTYSEWECLIERAVPLIESGSTTLKDARRGGCLTYHNGQTGWLKCPHCNPNGFTVW